MLLACLQAVSMVILSRGYNTTELRFHPSEHCLREVVCDCEDVCTAHAALDPTYPTQRAGSKAQEPTGGAGWKLGQEPS